MSDDDPDVLVNACPFHEGDSRDPGQCDCDVDVVVLPATVTQYGDPRVAPGERGWVLLPPEPGVCSQCARDHPPEVPHDAQSMHYQYAFYAEHHRWPTWSDAMEHCDEEIQTTWRELLRENGVEI